jgi:hypothetical protein
MFEPDRWSRDRGCRERPVDKGAEEVGEELRPLKETGWNKGGRPGGGRGETVRACVTGALLFRPGMADLHAYGGALCGRVPHNRPSARYDGFSSPWLPVKSKSDAGPRHSS